MNNFVILLFFGVFVCWSHQNVVQPTFTFYAVVELFENSIRFTVYVSALKYLLKLLHENLYTASINGGFTISHLSSVNK